MNILNVRKVICINIFLIFILVFKIEASSAEFSCKVTEKYDFGKIYSKAEIDKWKFSAKIEDHGTSAFVSRCSHSNIEGKVTCDRYEVDRIEYDKNVNIKKYYIYRSQYNIQMFKDLSFIEDNGRGGISYGKYKLTSP
jgi:hypothetical protein